MQSSEANDLLTISIKNKPLITVVYIWLLLSLCGMGILYTLSTNWNLILVPLIIFIVVLILRKLTFFYQIILGDKIFKIRMTFFGIEYSNIKFVYDNYLVNENVIYFYQINQPERLSIIYTEDLELDYLQVTVGKRKSIQIDSNEDAGIIFRQLVSKLTKKNNR